MDPEAEDTWGWKGAPIFDYENLDPFWSWKVALVYYYQSNSISLYSNQ